MRKGFVFVMVMAAAPSSMLAAPAPSLRSTMHAWRADARATHAMLTGHIRFDEEQIGNSLQAFAADAERISGQVKSHTPAARDFRRRLLAFGSDAQAALGDVGRRPALAADFSRLMSDCQSCHDRFKN